MIFSSNELDSGYENILNLIIVIQFFFWNLQLIKLKNFIALGTDSRC